jgi:hypothetical protein
MMCVISLCSNGAIKIQQFAARLSFSEVRLSGKKVVFKIKAEKRTWVFSPKKHASAVLP